MGYVWWYRGFEVPDRHFFPKFQQSALVRGYFIQVPVKYRSRKVLEKSENWRRFPGRDTPSVLEGEYQPGTGEVKYPAGTQTESTLTSRYLKAPAFELPAWYYELNVPGEYFPQVLARYRQKKSTLPVP